ALTLPQQDLPLLCGVRGAACVLEGPGEVFTDDLRAGVLVTVDRDRLVERELELLHRRVAASHLGVFGRQVVACGDGVGVLGAVAFREQAQRPLPGGGPWAR